MKIGFCLFWIGLLWLTGFSGKAQSLPRFIPYKTSTGWGYSDSNKKLLIAPRFKTAGLFWNGVAPVTLPRQKGRDLYCLIDTSGNYVVPPDWGWSGEVFPRDADLGGKSSDFFNIQDSLGRWGLINATGMKLIEPLYSSSRVFYKNEGRLYFQRYLGSTPQMLYALVWRDGKTGIIDTVGRELISVKYDSVFQCNWGTLFKVKLEGRWGAQELGGPLLLPPIYDTVIPYYNEGNLKGYKFVIVGLSGKMGVINQDNQTIVPLVYDSVELDPNLNPFLSKEFVGGFHTKQNGKWGWYSPDGKISIMPATENKLVRSGQNLYTVTQQKGRIRTLVFDSKGREMAVLPGRILQDFYVSNDSVFALKNVETDSSIRYFTSLYNLKRNKAIGPWQFRWEWKKLNSEIIIPSTPTYCGQHSLGQYRSQVGLTGYDYDHSFQSFSITGERTYSFSKDGTSWKFQSRLGVNINLLDPDAINGIVENRDKYTVFAVGPSQEPNTGALSGIVSVQGTGKEERDYTWKTPPQRKYQILGGNFFENVLLVAEENRYAFVDTHFRRRTAFASQPYMEYFRWKKQGYIIHHLLDSPATFHSLLLRDLYPCQSCKTHQVITDSAGKILWAPEKRYRIHYTPHFFPTDKPYSFLPQDAGGENGIIEAWDSTGTIGLFTPYGKVLYPALQFRYRQIKSIGRVGFMALNADRKYHLLNPKGQEWYPGFLASTVASNKEAQILSYPAHWNIGGLVRVFTVGTSNPNNSFFMSPKGVVYADDDVLPAEVRTKR